ncbi:DUF1707 domain-containing protein [Streptomyces hundungensis]|uniref:DUF1707 domain-containing protein n=1 Tax=Streptomyces hundungensis TaxID=1077946 RepID=UPI0033D557AB
MRASDAERERVAESLRDALAEGRLDMEEFEQRLEAAYTARTHGELEPLVRDLPAPGTPGPAARAVRRPEDEAEVHWPSRIGHAPTSKGGFALWGGFSRKGTWTVARKFTAFAMWGGGDIDLREARFEARETVLRIFTIMGGIGVTVPPELAVQVKGFGVMGAVGGSKANGEGTPGSPHVTIVAFALLGGIGVDRKPRKAQRERLRAERERERLERMEGQGGGRKELG